MPDLGKTVDELKDAIISTVEEKAKGFLKDNADARIFLYDRAKRLAQAGYAYALESDEAAKVQLKEDMKVIEQSIANELASVAVTAQAASKALFRSILETAVGVFVKAIPAIVSAL